MWSLKSHLPFYQFYHSFIMGDITDDRFKHISTDPRFRSTPKSIKKVKIDKRFQSLFSDKRFQVKYTVDKRGRPINQSSSENLRKYYDLSSDEDSSSSSGNDDDGNGNIGEKPNLRELSKIEQHESNNISKTICSNSKTVKKKTVALHKEETNVSCSNNESKPEVSDDRSAVMNIVVDCKKKTDNNFQSTCKKEKQQNKNYDQMYKNLMTHEVKMKLRDPKIDYARGVGTLLTDSSSDEESVEDSEDENLDHKWGEFDNGAETTEEATSRLAALHMDWDRIRAVDLMVLFNSFLPRAGVIHSVAIYPSDFGQQRMKEEDEKGPIELVNMRAEDAEDVNEGTKEGKKFHRERLRQYQLNRLKYFYAVVTFDSPESAGKVYNECDGMEYESSATKLDLRFVPEDETFDQEPREECTSMPDPAKYEARLFVNTALQQGKVDLTWDETDPSRLELNKKILSDADKVDITDLQAYLAYSSDEDEGDGNKDTANIKKEDEQETEEGDNNEKEDNKIEKYKSLLASLEKEEEKKKSKDVDLEITWGVGLKERAEKSVKEKLNAPQTPFEQMMEKKRQKNKLKRVEKQKIKDKRESDSDESSEDDIPSDVDMNDPYFKEELTGLKRNKKNKLTKNIVEEESEDEKRRKAELELLMIDEDDKEQNKSHFSLKSIQEQESETKKKKRKKFKKKKPEVKPTDKDDFQIDFADDRFSALYSSHHFNIDPTNPQFRKTKNMEALVSEKLKRRRQEELEAIPTTKSAKRDPELSLLIKSVKNKTKAKR